MDSLVLRLFLCAWSANVRRPPWLKTPIHGVVYGVWDLPCISVYVPYSWSQYNKYLPSVYVIEQLLTFTVIWALCIHPGLLPLTALWNINSFHWKSQINAGCDPHFQIFFKVFKFKLKTPIFRNVLTIDVKTISSVWLCNLTMLVFILRAAFSGLFQNIRRLRRCLFAQIAGTWMKSYKTRFQITDIFFLKNQLEEFLVFLFYT